jgi:hypothetical protein
MKLDILLLVAGSGRNSGKTTFVCKIIEQFHHLVITSIKISPHFHNPSDGLIPITSKSGYAIYEETNSNTLKDSSKMLNNGAGKVYYIQTRMEYLNESFSDVYMKVEPDKPVIYESPGLIHYFKPGLFIIMTSLSGCDLKKIKNLKRFPHKEYILEEVLKITTFPIDFAGSVWKSLK